VSKESIARRLKEEGWVLVWSSVVNDQIAFVWDERTLSQVPANVVPYTRAEVKHLVGSDPGMLKLVHEAKKHGAVVKRVER
jgi:hypothetical protein